MFAAALAVRLASAFQLVDLPLVRTPKLDSFEYLSWARQLAAGDFHWPALAAHAPGYPVFLAALLHLFSGSITAALVVQAILGAVTAVLVAALANRWFDRVAGLSAGLIYAFYGPAVFVETTILSEGLLVFLLVAALAALALGAISTRRAAAAGVLFGLAITVRPTAAIVVACVAIAFVVLAWRQREPWLRIAALAGVTVLVAAPAIVKNWSVSNVLGTQGFGGLNFYIGNSPLHSGRPTFRLGAGWDTLNSEASRAGIANPSSQDRYYVAKALGEIREHPGSYAKLVVTKALWIAQAEEVRDSHSYYFFTDRVAFLAWLPGMALLFPLALAGVVVSIENKRLPLLLIAYVCGAGLSVILLVVGTRYRMPMIPALAVAGGAGVSAVVASARSRSARAGVVCVASLAAGIAVSHVLSDQSSRNLAEEWALTGSSLVTEHRLDEAEAAYHEALAADPRSSLAWDGLGLTFYDRGRLADARDAFDRALRLEPDNARALYHRGIVEEREGSVSAAAQDYARAMSLAPGDTDIARRAAAIR